MDWTVYALIFFLVMLILLWLYIGLYVAMSIITPKVRNLDETAYEEDQRDHELLDYYQNHLTDDYAIKSTHNYPLHVYEMIQDPSIKKYVVIVHGYTYSHHGSIKYAKMMMALGYNVIMYDHRYHGNSGGKNTTLGYFEAIDLKTLIDHIYQKYGQDIFLGTYGESMGSATCLIEQESDPRVKFVVSDAGFTNLKKLIVKQLKVKKLPPKIFYGVASFFIWMISRSHISKVNPIKSIQSSQIPIFFVHGKQDDFIPYQHAIDMHEAYNGPKHLYLADGNAFHARSYYANKTTYIKALKHFFDHYVRA
jgi:alpha-beta hydrolase superfamily lysophospholipase